jgi:hypothetical protein
VSEFASKLGDTALWSSIGAVVMGLLIKLIRSVQTLYHRREDKPSVPVKLGSK